MNRSHYYDRQGQRITLKEWRRHLNDPTRKIVKQETLANGLRASTIWFGLDYRSDREGPPLIFSTMVFQSPFDVLDSRWYATEAEALQGHQELVSKWQGVAR